MGGVLALVPGSGEVELHLPRALVGCGDGQRRLAVQEVEGVLLLDCGERPRCQELEGRHGREQVFVLVVGHGRGPVTVVKDIERLRRCDLLDAAVLVEQVFRIHDGPLDGVGHVENLAGLARAWQACGVDGLQREPQATLADFASRVTRVVLVVLHVGARLPLHLQLARAVRTDGGEGQVLLVRVVLAGALSLRAVVPVGLAGADGLAVHVAARALPAVCGVAGVGVVVCVVAAGDNGDQDRCGQSRGQEPIHGFLLIVLSCFLPGRDRTHKSLCGSPERIVSEKVV